MPSFLEKKILQALTPEQAEGYAGGADPDSIRLPSGETLGDFIARLQRSADRGLVFQPLPPCRVLDTSETNRKLSPGEKRTLLLRGERTDYSELGGAAGGCGVPGLTGDKLKTNRARAVFLNVQVREAEGEGELKIWPASAHDAPALGLVRYGDLATVHSSAIVSMCDDESLDPCGSGDVALEVSGSGAHVAVSVLGYFDSLSGHLASNGAKEPREKGTTDWIPNGDDIYFEGGNVGIGIDEPQAPLHITGGGDIILDDSDGGGVATVLFRLQGTDIGHVRAVSSGVQLRGTGAVPYIIAGASGMGVDDLTPDAHLEVSANGGTGGDIFLLSSDDADDGDILTVTEAGDVGIGTTSPGARLHASGGTGSVELLVEADTDDSGEADQPKITLSQDGGNVSGQLGYFSSSNDLKLINNSGGAQVVLKSNGDVCIGSCS